MGTIVIDAELAAKLSEPGESLELRTAEGRLIGVFRPMREATPEDYARAQSLFTEEEIEAGRRSGPGRPLKDILADLQRRYGS